MGKICHSTPKRVDTSEIYELPVELMERHKNVTIGIDILFFNYIAFFVSVSRDIIFHTIEKIDKRDIKTFLGCMRKIIALYSNRGFKVNYLLGDGEFRHM